MNTTHIFLDDLVKMAKKSGMPEVLDAVALIVLEYAATRPDDEEHDWIILSQDIQRLASKAACYEEHFKERRGS